MVHKLKSLVTDMRGSVGAPALFGGFATPTLLISGQNKLLAFANRLTVRQWLLLGLGAYAGLALGTTAAFMLPATTSFAYSGQNCMKNPTFLPGLAETTQSGGFQLKLDDTLRLGPVRLYSHRTCVEATSVPEAGRTASLSIAPLGNPIAKKTVRISNPALPSVSITTDFSQPVVTSGTFDFKLDQADSVFDYTIAGNNNEATCSKDGTKLVCELAPLKLTQSQSYQLELKRTFNGEPAGSVLAQSITTIDPVIVTAATITNGQMVYSIPTGITLTMNKPVNALGKVRLLQLAGDGNHKETAIKTESKDNSIVITFDAPLARSQNFELAIDHIEATDRSQLMQPYSLRFATSGGPKVLGASIGNYKVAQNSAVTITFDSNLSAAQAKQSFGVIEVGGKVVPATVTTNANRLTIKPAAGLPHCTAFTVRILDGLQNEAGISGGSAWSFNSRTICQTTFSIGTSAQGRSIVGYKFGNGAKKLVFVGGTHGNERSSVYILNSFVDHLESVYPTIPADKTIYIIPVVNPDGYAANIRTNAGNVDLNRNFPANNWKQGVTMPDKTYNANGGGNYPLSEPESAALASFVQAQKPTLVLTYHSTGGVVISNDAGNSHSLAVSYGLKAGYWSSSNANTGTIFQYDTTGAFEDWLADKLAIPTVLVELRTHTGNEFSTHRNAMWAMITGS